MSVSIDWVLSDNNNEEALEVGIKLETDFGSRGMHIIKYCIACQVDIPLTRFISNRVLWSHNVMHRGPITHLPQPAL